MTREEQLEYCKICKNQKFSFSKGIICGLTDERADFEGECEYFEESEVLVEEQKNQTKYFDTVSGGKRFLNYFLDILFIYGLSAVFGFFLGILLVVTNSQMLNKFLQEDNILANYALGFIIVLIYYVVLEAKTGRTIAKYITKTKVVDSNGETPDLGTIFIRTLCRFIPFEAFSFLGSDASGWHDKLSKTKVVNV